MINQVRFGRQSAVRIFAQEYSDANLPLEGVGEYAPSFIITKLGAKTPLCGFGGQNGLDEHGPRARDA